MMRASGRDCAMRAAALVDHRYEVEASPISWSARAPVNSDVYSPSVTSRRPVKATERTPSACGWGLSRE